MYINSLGTLRINTHTQKNNTQRLSNANNFATTMKNAVESRNTLSKTGSSSVLKGGVLITADALERMKTDPEWAQKVMDKIENRYSNDEADAKTTGLQIIEGTGKDSYLSRQLMEQSGLQNYWMQRFLSGQSGWGTLSASLGMPDYYSSGLGSLAVAAYGNGKNSLLNTSLLGSMFI